MPIIVRNIRLGLDEPDEKLLQAAAKRLRVPPDAIRSYAISKRSLDARKADDLHFSYQVELELDESIRTQRSRIARLGRADVSMLEPLSSTAPRIGRTELRHRPVVVGFGPGGMFAALRLAQFGYRPVILERGREVRRRHRDILQRFYRDGEFDPTSNLLFGEGGAGTYSDGKLYTRVNDSLCREVLEAFYHNGADPDILIETRPHIGSDRLPTICTNIRKKIESMGGTVRFECRLSDLSHDGGHMDRICVARSDAENGDTSAAAWEPCGPVIVAVGHSARDTIRMLHRRGVPIEAKPFQIGVRIEHPQSLVDKWQYGTAAGHHRLAPAHYHAVAKSAGGNGGDVFCFCMCPGGEMLPTNESHGLIATNGASRASRSGEFANSGLVMTVDPTDPSWSAMLKSRATGSDDHPALAALSFLERLERKAYESTGASYRLPAQRAADFLAERSSDGELTTSYPLGGQWADIGSLLPEHVASAMKRGIALLERNFPGFAGMEGLVAAPETRASGPVRLSRDRETRQAVGVADLYPVGEGAGYAGGIVSAAVDGIRSADKIIEHYAPPR